MDKIINADKLKRHYSWWKNGTDVMTLDEAMNIFNQIIDVQPQVIIADESIQSEATWIPCATSEHYKCSNCNSRAPYYWDKENQCYSEWLSPVCPECGSKIINVR